MKKMSMTILGLMTCFSAMAGDCREVYQTEINKPPQLVSSAVMIGDGIGRGIVTGAAAYGAVWSVSTIGVAPFMLAGIGLWFGTDKLIDVAKDSGKKKLINLINDAYVYRDSKSIGKALNSYQSELEKNEIKFDSGVLAENIIRANENGSLCATYFNYNQLKKSLNTNLDIKCVISLPSNTKTRFMTRMQKEFGKDGAHFIKDADKLGDFNIRFLTVKSRTPISAHRVLVKEEDFFVTEGQDYKREYLSKTREKKLNKNFDMIWYDSNHENLSLLKEVIADTVAACQ
jgi:hypothetical protein